jgi:hypothetical protein
MHIPQYRKKPRRNQVRTKIRGYHRGLAGDEHHRYRSWEHCYRFFRQLTPSELTTQRDTAALQLAFYLASWGMYRGSTFLLQYAYTAHLGVIDCLSEPRFSPLWESEFGSGKNDLALVPTVLDVIQASRKAYEPFGYATDTLVTKVILGTLGCLPACDQYFIEGFNQAFSYSSLNARFVDRLLLFCKDYLADLRGEQERIERSSRVHYPIMKLVDMCFWQTSKELNDF